MRTFSLLLCGVLSACGPTRLSVGDDRIVEGDVVAADAERHSVQLRLADGRKRWLSIETVEDIDLPGEWGIAGGALTALAGGAMLVNVMGEPTRSVTHELGQGIFIGLGSSLLVWGLAWAGFSVHHRVQTSRLIDEARAR
jgi:hypothetical protein